MMLFSGAVLGLAFNSYRVVSEQLHFPRWCTHLLDLVYWLGAAMFVFEMLFRSNNGELRLYVFLGLFLGGWIYFLLFSVATEKFVVMLIKIIRIIWRGILRTYHILIVTPLIGLYKLIKMLLRFAWATTIFLGKIMLQCLMPFWKLFMWMLSPLVKATGMNNWIPAIKRTIISIWKRWFKGGT
ncbi:spore cortex biosynthesis protein YabQ [Paenibacillus sediminis]|uniref:Spore cortex biosynthesis protein YabQ n=2 Tax=Paenibacillus sediminis TaxID=664909 RepID=A0ABS4H7D3_9BACL|nr:spore cortex biosynthesis protein YabQ [Paenibacillus sediminis]